MKFFIKKGLRNKAGSRSGVSALELLIVLALLGLLIGVVVPQFSRIRQNQALKNATGDILSSINKARAESLGSLNSSEYGIHFQSDKIIIYKGTAFSVGATSNETVDLITPASITNVTLGGVSSSTGNVYFNPLNGAPSTTGTVSVSNGVDSKIITISATGTASMN